MRMQYRAGLFLIAWLLAGMAPATSLIRFTPSVAESNAQSMTLKADIKIAADGSVTAIRHLADTPPTFRLMLEQAIRGWRFLPKAGRGVAQASATRLTLALRQVTGGSSWVVSSAELSPAWHDPQQQKHYIDNHLWGSPPPLLDKAPFRTYFMVRIGDKIGHNEVLAAWVDGTEVALDHPFVRYVRRDVAVLAIVALEWDGKRYADVVCVPISISDHGKFPPADAKENERVCKLLSGASYQAGDEQIRFAEPVLGHVLKQPAPNVFLDLLKKIHRIHIH